MKHWHVWVASAGVLWAVTFAARPLAAQATPASIKVANELTTKDVGAQESNLAEVIADAVRDTTGADAAFLAASAFNEVTIPKGVTTTDEVLKALAFKSDSVRIVRLKGSQIRQALERAVELYPQRRSAFLQVSGITVTVDPNADPGKRIVSVKVGKSDLNESTIYTVAMPAPLADGALTYYKVWSKADIDRDHDPNITLEEAVTRYLASHTTIGEKGEDRIVFKK
ncbi:MAG: 5'-nucleotidase [Chthonomonadales bacterium]